MKLIIWIEVIDEMNLSKVNLNLLIAFDALMTERHVTRAGEKIFITQSAMSSALAQLRELFDDPLLVRDGNTMQPTVKALHLHEEVKPLLEKIADIVEPQDFDPKTSTHRFRIGMSDYVEFILLPKLLPALKKVAPNIKLDIVHVNSLDSKQTMLDQHLDLVIGVIFEEHAGSKLESELLFIDGAACVTTKDNPLLKGRLTLKRFLDAEHIAIIFPKEPYRSCIDNNLDRMNLARNTIITVPHMLPAFFALQNTPYILTTTELIAKRMAKLLNLVVKKPPIEIEPAEIVQIWLPQFTDKPEHQWLRAQMHKVVKQVTNS